MPQHDDMVLLHHMVDASRQAMLFVENRARDDLDTDMQLTLALVKAVEIVGEAAFHVSEKTRLSLPDVPWEDMIGMRHRLVHAYFDINPDILWRTVQHDLPALVFLLAPCL
jgi:uncharacterized protein with HEPN domain